MKYRLIQSVDGHLVASEFDRESLVPAMEIRGFRWSGQNRNSRQRAELQGEPLFCGLNGPMWDGDAIRYEDREAYAQLSA